MKALFGCRCCACCRSLNSSSFRLGELQARCGRRWSRFRAQQGVSWPIRNSVRSFRVCPRACATFQARSRHRSIRVAPTPRPGTNLSNDSFPPTARRDNQFGLLQISTATPTSRRTGSERRPSQSARSSAEERTRCSPGNGHLTANEAMVNAACERHHGLPTVARSSRNLASTSCGLATARRGRGTSIRGYRSVLSTAVNKAIQNSATSCERHPGAFGDSGGPPIRPT